MVFLMPCAFSLCIFEWCVCFVMYFRAEFNGVCVPGVWLGPTMVQNRDSISPEFRLRSRSALHRPKHYQNKPQAPPKYSKAAEKHTTKTLEDSPVVS